MELKALNIIKSLVISSMRNETGSNLGWVFLPGLPQKNPLGFWVYFRVSEPLPAVHLMFLYKTRYKNLPLLSLSHQQVLKSTDPQIKQIAVRRV